MIIREVIAPPLTVPIAGETLILCPPVQNDLQQGPALTVGDPVVGEASHVVQAEPSPRRDYVLGPHHLLSRRLLTAKSFKVL